MPQKTAQFVPIKLLNAIKNYLNSWYCLIFQKTEIEEDTIKDYEITEDAGAKLLLCAIGFYWSAVKMALQADLLN